MKKLLFIFFLSLTFTIKISVRDSIYKYDLESIFIDNGGPYSIDEYKNASTIKGAKQIIMKTGMKNPPNKLIKETADFNSNICEGIKNEFAKTIESLKTKMKSTDNW
jgi:hypothetical protein